MILKCSTGYKSDGNGNCIALAKTTEFAITKVCGDGYTTDEDGDCQYIKHTPAPVDYECTTGFVRDGNGACIQKRVVDALTVD